jgi:PAS domain S-box-containing protein
MSTPSDCSSLAYLQTMILDQIPDAIIVLDRGGRIVFWNHGAERLCHLAVDRALGKRPNEAQLSPWFSTEEETAVFAAIARGEVWRCEAVRSNGDGRTRHLERSIAALGAPDADPIGFLVIMRDLSPPSPRQHDRCRAGAHRASERLALLVGLIPICAHCKRIRDPGGMWHEPDGYLSEQLGVKFTHGICPVCVRGLHPDYCNRPPTSP